MKKRRKREFWLLKEGEFHKIDLNGIELGNNIKFSTRFRNKGIKEKKNHTKRSISQYLLRLHKIYFFVLKRRYNEKATHNGRRSAKAIETNER